MSNSWIYYFHGTIIQTGITFKKISCYMCDSTCSWFIVENAKIFRSYVKHFSIFPHEKIIESWLVYENVIKRS